MSPCRRLRPLAFLISVCLVCVGPSGCGLHAKPTSGSPPATRSGAGVGADPFEPRSIRIHPLTRIDIDPESSQTRIDVFFELRDRWNHGVKALGQVVLELYEVSGPANATRGGPLQLRVWKVDLTDPDTNAGPYDRVTRTYHLSLADVPPGLPVDRDLELLVRFTTLSGEQLVASYRFAGR